VCGAGIVVAIVTVIRGLLLVSSAETLSPIVPLQRSTKSSRKSRYTLMAAVGLILSAGALAGFGAAGGTTPKVSSSRSSSSTNLIQQLATNTQAALTPAPTPAPAPAPAPPPAPAAKPAAAPSSTPAAPAAKPAANPLAQLTQLPISLSLPITLLNIFLSRHFGRPLPPPSAAPPELEDGFLSCEFGPSWQVGNRDRRSTPFRAPVDPVVVTGGWRSDPNRTRVVAAVSGVAVAALVVAGFAAGTSHHRPTGASAQGPTTHPGGAGNSGTNPAPPTTGPETTTPPVTAAASAAAPRCPLQWRW
jgi:hypothetical protein